MDYTWLDFIIILIFFFNIALGVARGLTREIISMVSLIIALVIAIKFTVPLSDFLVSLVGFQDVVSSFSTLSKYNATGPLSLISFGVSFLVLLFVPFFIVEATSYYATNAGMLMFFPIIALLDRALGGVLGFVRGYVFNLILILVLGLTPMIRDSGWTQSAFIPQLMPKASQLGAMVRPGGFPAWS